MPPSSYGNLLHASQSSVFNVLGALYDIMAAPCKNSKLLIASPSWFAPLHGVKYAVFKVVKDFTKVKESMIVHYKIQHFKAKSRKVKLA